MQSKAQTPDEYIEELAEPRKAEIKKLHQLIRRAVPDLRPHMVYGMLGYGPFHYKYKSGREGDWAVVGLASQKNYISLYICAAKDGKYIAEANKSRLPKASIGRSCIRFKKIADIDLEVVEELLQEAAEWVKDPANFAV